MIKKPYILRLKPARPIMILKIRNSLRMLKKKEEEIIVRKTREEK